MKHMQKINCIKIRAKKGYFSDLDELFFAYVSMIRKKNCPKINIEKKKWEKQLKHFLL